MILNINNGRPPAVYIFRQSRSRGWVSYVFAPGCALRCGPVHFGNRSDGSAKLPG